MDRFHLVRDDIPKRGWSVAYPIAKGCFGAVIVCVLLAGCGQFVEEQRAHAEFDAAWDATRVAAEDDATCRSTGAEPESPAYKQCRVNVQNERAEVAAHEREIAVQHLLSRR
jgi:hypothetical protein